MTVCSSRSCRPASARCGWSLSIYIPFPMPLRVRLGEPALAQQQVSAELSGLIDFRAATERALQLQDRPP
jgi:hypothetical protein